MRKILFSLVAILMLGQQAHAKDILTSQDRAMLESIERPIVLPGFLPAAKWLVSVNVCTSVCGAGPGPTYKIEISSQYGSTKVVIEAAPGGDVPPNCRYQKVTTAGAGTLDACMNKYGGFTDWHATPGRDDFYFSVFIEGSDTATASKIIKSLTVN